MRRTRPSRAPTSSRRARSETTRSSSSVTLDAGADVNAKDSYNGTGLIRAADRGYVEIVRRLLETEIDIDHVNRLGWTALLEAIILGGGDERHIGDGAGAGRRRCGREPRRRRRRETTRSCARSRVRRDRSDPQRHRREGIRWKRCVGSTHAPPTNGCSVDVAAGRVRLEVVVGHVQVDRVVRARERLEVEASTPSVTFGSPNAGRVPVSTEPLCVAAETR